MTYVILSNVVVWLGIGGYLMYLALGQKRLEKKIKQLEAISKE